MAYITLHSLLKVTAPSLFLHPFARPPTTRAQNSAGDGHGTGSADEARGARRAVRALWDLHRPRFGDDLPLDPSPALGDDAAHQQIGRAASVCWLDTTIGDDHRGKLRPLFSMGLSCLLSSYRNGSASLSAPSRRSYYGKADSMQTISTQTSRARVKFCGPPSTAPQSQSPTSSW